MLSRSLSLSCIVTVGCVGLFSSIAHGQQAVSPNLVFVTEDTARPASGGGPIQRGCEAITAFDSATGRILYRAPSYVSPGRLAIGAGVDGVLAVANQSNHTVGVRLARLDPNGSWGGSLLSRASLATMGGIAVGASGAEFYAAEAHVAYESDGTRPNSRPYYISRFSVRDGVPRTLGQPSARANLDELALEILPDRGSNEVHVVTGASTLHTFSADTLIETEAPILFDEFVAPVNPLHPSHEDRVHADLTADGRYALIGLGDSSEMAVLDLEARSASTLRLPVSSGYVGGVALNKGWVHPGHLAVHSRDSVSVFEFIPPNRATLVDSIEVFLAAHYLATRQVGPKMSVAWSGSGDSIIAANDSGAGEFSVFDFSPGSGLALKFNVDVCPVSLNDPNGIETLNGWITPTPPTPSPTPSQTTTPTTRPSASPLPTVTATRTPTPTASSTATPEPSSTPAPTFTPQPRPVFLPLLLREACQPDQRRADVVLVIDASTSMLELTGANRSKLEAAREAASRLVDELDLSLGDQVGLVAFNEDVVLTLPLSSDSTAIAQAIASIQASPGTCIPCAMEGATELLFGTRHRETNTPALVMLTDGQSNVRPVQEAVALADAAKLRGAEIFTVGLGEAIESDALEAMASQPAFFYRTLDAEALGEIFENLVFEIPCPVSRFWGKR